MNDQSPTNKSINTINVDTNIQHQQPPTIPAVPKRVPSVTFAPFPDSVNNQSSTHPSVTRSRSSSHAHSINSNLSPYQPMIETNNNVNNTTNNPKRSHSLSVSSVNSVDSSNSSIYNQFKDFENDEKSPYPVPKGKIRLMDDVDLENQLILTAGGKREHVLGFLFKLFFLMFIVLGSGVLIFYAL